MVDSGDVECKRKRLPRREACGLNRAHTADDDGLPSTPSNGNVSLKLRNTKTQQTYCHAYQPWLLEATFRPKLPLVTIDSSYVSPMQTAFVSRKTDLALRSRFGDQCLKLRQLMADSVAYLDSVISFCFVVHSGGEIAATGRLFGRYSICDPTTKLGCGFVGKCRSRLLEAE